MARQQSRLRLFESGLCFQLVDGELTQTPYLGGLVLGPVDRLNWCNDTRDVDFFDVKGDIESLMTAMQVSDDITMKSAQHPALQAGQTARLFLNEVAIGWLGALDPNLQQKLGFNNKVFLFELVLSELIERNLPKFVALSRFPAVSRDLAFIADEGVDAAQLLECVKQAGGEWLTDVKIFDVYQGQGIGVGKKSLALALTLQHPSRTLKDGEVNNLIERVVAQLTQELDVILRD